MSFKVPDRDSRKSIADIYSYSRVWQRKFSCYRNVSNLVGITEWCQCRSEDLNKTDDVTVTSCCWSINQWSLLRRTSHRIKTMSASSKTRLRMALTAGVISSGNWCMTRRQTDCERLVCGRCVSAVASCECARSRLDDADAVPSVSR